MRKDDGFEKKLVAIRGQLVKHGVYIGCQEAEDLVQDAIARSLDCIRRDAPEVQLLAFLKRVMVNLFIDQSRNRAIQLAKGAACLDCNWQDGSEFLDSALMVDDCAEVLHRMFVRQCLARLEKRSSAYYETFMLRYIGGYALEEIGTAHQVPIGTVKSRLIRAQRYLATVFASYAEAPNGR